MKTLIHEEVKKLFHSKVHEECALVVQPANGPEYLFPCRNIWPEPDKAFVVHPKDWIQAEKAGKIKAIVHSHIDGDLEPTEFDWTGCKKSGLPWFIVSPIDHSIQRIDPPEAYATLIGRQFSWGDLDCYSVMRDWLYSQKKVLLNDYPRDGEFFKSSNPFEDLAEKEGFSLITDGTWRSGDVILFNIGHENVNHCALFLEPDKILHHVEGCLSRVDPLTGAWQKRIKGRYRHRSLA